MGRGRGRKRRNWVRGDRQEVKEEERQKTRRELGKGRWRKRMIYVKRE